MNVASFHQFRHWFFMPCLTVLLCSASGCNQTAQTNLSQSEIANTDLTSYQEDPFAPLDTASVNTSSEPTTMAPEQSQPSMRMKPVQAKLAVAAAPVNNSVSPPKPTQLAALPNPVGYIEHFYKSTLPAWPKMPPNQAQTERLSQASLFTAKIQGRNRVPIFKNNGTYLLVATTDHQMKWIRKFDVRLPPKECISGRGVSVNGKGSHAVASGASSAGVVCK